MTDIEKLRELLGKATPGPWVLATVEPSATGALYPYAMWVNGAGPRLVQVGKAVCIHADDMALIVELRNAIAPLLDRVEKMEFALKEIADDYSERHDVNDPSTNPGIKYVIALAYNALRGKGE